MTIQEIESSSCKRVFKFGLSLRYVIDTMVNILAKLLRGNGKDGVIQIQGHVIDADIPFLCGKLIMELLESMVGLKKKVLDTNIDGHNKEFSMVETIFTMAWC